jgi:oxygen-dependent protoporphyrinogen oxidase
VLGVPVDRASVEETGLLGAAAHDRLEAGPTSRPIPRCCERRGRRAFLRRLGDAVVDRMVAPLLGGVNAGSVDELSIEAGTPWLTPPVAGAAASRRSRLAAADPSVRLLRPPEGMRRIVETL